MSLIALAPKTCASDSTYLQEFVELWEINVGYPYRLNREKYFSLIVLALKTCNSYSGAVLDILELC